MCLQEFKVDVTKGRPHLTVCKLEQVSKQLSFCARMQQAFEPQRNFLHCSCRIRCILGIGVFDTTFLSCNTSL